MEQVRALKLVLVISGVIPLIVGTATLLAPVAFFASSGIQLPGDASLLSEIRAPGGGLVACGALVISGAFVPRLAFTSTLVSTCIYFGYGLARVLSVAVDGLPAPVLVAVTVVELVAGVVGAVALWRYTP